MPDIIITPSSGKLEFVDNSAQVTRRHSFTLDANNGVNFDAPLSAAAISAPLNVINVTVNNSNVNYPFVLASGSAETGTKTLMMDGAGGTYNPFTNLATIDISGNAATTTLASDSTNLGGVAAASYVTLTGTQTLTNKTITGTFTGNLTGTGSWATNAVNANTATNSTQLNGQAASYYQTALNGTGFVKISGTTISYDNSTYTPTSRTITAGTGISGGGDLSANRTIAVDDTVSRKYTSTINNVTSSAWTTVCNVVGDNLSSAIRATFNGTSNSVVVNVLADILVNHFQDIIVYAISGFYSKLTIRIITNNDASFTLQVKHDGGTSTNLAVEIFPLNTETITFNPGTLFSTTTFDHICEWGVSTSGNGGNNSDIRTAGIFYGAGTGLTGTATNLTAGTATNATQLNGQAASYYTNIPARLGYTPVNQAGDTISGNLTVNGNFAVNGSVTAFSASNIYITSSNLTVTDNILIMNALSPYQRYAGIQMYDSGSGTLSQFLWDGEGDYFFLTGSAVNGKIITGPDGQTNLTANYIPKATAGYKLGNSLIYDNGTNVGIGTTSAAQKLDVVGNIRCVPASSAWAEGLSFSMPTTSSWGGLRWRRERGSADGNHYIGYIGTDTTDDLVFGSNNGGTQIDNNIRITKAGLVGIGTSSPSYKLDVGAAGNDVVSVRLTPGYERVRYYGFDLLGYNDGNLWMIGNNPTNTLVLGKTWDWDNQIGIAYTPGTVGNSGGILQIGQISKNNANYTHGITRLYTNGLERITIIANGNVGISTTLPTTPLHVVGVISGSSFSGAGTGLTGTASGLSIGGSAASCTGNAATATILQTARNIGGVSFNGSADINLPGVNTAGNQNTSGNAATATTASYANALNSANNYTAVQFITTGKLEAGGNVIAGGQFSGAGTGLTGTAASLTAGTANSVAWTNVSSRPTAVSAFTNDSLYQYHRTDITSLSSSATNLGQPLGTFDANNATNGPTNAWYNYLSSTHGGYLTSLIANRHRSSQWYVGYKEGPGGTPTNPTWYELLHSGNYSSFTNLTASWATNAVTALNVGNGTITIAAGTGVGVGTTNTFTTNQSGATTVTITNTGVTSLTTNTGLSSNVSATGAVTVTNTGVTAITTNTGLSTNASATGAVTITNTGVTSNVAGTGISVSGATGAVTITNSGVTSAVAGTGVSVSGATGAVTISIGQAVGTSNSPTFAGLVSTGNVGIGTTSATARLHVSGSTGGVFEVDTAGNTTSLYVSASGNIGVNTTDFSYTTSDNSRLVGSNTNNRMFVNGSIQLLNNNDAIVIGRSTATFLTDEELGFGWGGGWYMVDDTWVRVRNNKYIYGGSGVVRTDGEFQLGGSGAYFLANSTETKVASAVLRVITDSITAANAGTRGFILDGNYTNGQYRHRWRKYDDGNGLPLYIDYAHATANSYTAIARFGGGGSYNSFTVYGTQDISGNLGVGGVTSPNGRVESYYNSSAITFNYLATNLNNNSPIPVYGFDVTNGSTESRAIKAGIGYERHLTNGRGAIHFYNASTNDTQSISGNRTSAGDIKMTIQNDGNVGIGYVQPSYTLAVNGTFYVNSTGYFNGSLTVDDNLIITAGNDFGIYDSDGTGAMWQYIDAGIANIRIDDGSTGNGKLSVNSGLLYVGATGGNVGINTTSPSWLLTVYAATAPQFTLQNGTRSFILTNNSADNLLSFYYNSANRLQFDLTNQWFNTGNLGIGTTSPSALLNVRASAPTGTGTVTTGTNVLIDSNTNNYITFRNTADNGTYAGLIFLDNNVGGYIAFGNAGAAVGSDSMIYGAYQDHIFQNNYVNETLYNRTETMRIKQSGNVGIGSNNPQCKLDVAGTIRSTSTEIFGFGASDNVSIRAASTSNVMGLYTSNAEKVRIDSSGNVGIGTSNPGRKLDVEGIVRTRGASGTGGFEISAATTGTAKWRIEWDSASDSLDFNWVG